MDNTENVRGDKRKEKKKKTLILKYRILNYELRNKTDREKEKFINETCDEMTKLLQTGRYDLMYQEEKKLEQKDNN